MKLPDPNSLELNEKRVLVRADLDVGDNHQRIYRLEAMLPTLKLLFDKKCKVFLMGHRGRPKGEYQEHLGMKKIKGVINDIFIRKWGEEYVKSINYELLENLRFYKGESENDENFAKGIAKRGEVFINEAFAVSHRNHASIVGLPKILPHAAGLRFMAEVENLSKVFNKPKRPVIVIVGGLKQDKTKHLQDLSKFADKILVGGRLPDYIPEYSEIRMDVKYMIANLIPDKEDITVHSIEKFQLEILRAKTIILAGPPGKFEDEGHRMGTQRILEAISRSSALKIAGGGDTIRALTLLNMRDRLNWVSVGGGAMLEFLAKRTLPGIEALTANSQ